jgi:hypothetical protein
MRRPTSTRGSSAVSSNWSSWKKKSAAISRLDDASPELIRRAKENGFSDAQLAFWWDCSQMEVREHRKGLNIVATFKQVDTCAASSKPTRRTTIQRTNQEDETPAKLPARNAS